MARVSVLIPNYQGERWLRTTIQSCLQQKYLLEIIVVDDGSVDESLSLVNALMREHPDVIRLYNNPVKGGNNARNHAFSLSKGEFIQWLDADDQIKDGKFETQVRYFDNHKDVDIVYSDWELLTYDGDQLVRHEIKKNESAPDFLTDLLMDKWSPPNCYLLRREAAGKLYDLRAWNPDTRVLQDREYFTIAGILGFNFGYAEGVYAVYNRWNRNSVSAARADVKYSTTENILNRFESLIQNRQEITGKQKERYLDIILTEKILLRTLGYPAKIEKGVKWGRISWSMIKGARTNIRFLWQILKLKSGRRAKNQTS